MAAPPIWPWALGGAGGGLIAGSFMATIALRWPAGRSIADGRSRCDGCGAALAGFELVPVASYLALGGRCRRCKVRIDARHLWIELSAALVGAAALAVAPGGTGVVAAFAGWLLLTLAVLDAEHFWLPDALTLPLLGLGLTAGICGVAPALAEHVIGMAAGWAALALLAASYAAVRGRTGIGAGDAKLLAAIGAWLGWRILPLVVLTAALAGLALVGVRLALRRPVTRHDPVPLGSLLAASAWLLWLASRLTMLD